MGAWSATIMGGDTPLDVQYWILEKLGFSEDQINDDEIEELKSKLQTQQLEVMQYLQLEKFDHCDGEQLLVLGYMLLQNGCTIEQEVKEAVILACVNDEWAETDEERQKYVQELKENIENNTGTPIELKNEGLFEKLEEHLKAGKTGLLNK